MKFKSIFYFLISILGSTGVALSSYIIYDSFDLANFNVEYVENDNSSSEDKLYRVSFNIDGEDEEKVMYVKEGDKVYATDAPKLYDSDGYYIWKDESTGLTLNNLGSDSSNLTDGIVVTQDLNFICSSDSKATINEAETKDDLTSSEVVTNGGSFEEPEHDGFLGIGNHDDFKLTENDDNFEDGSTSNTPKNSLILDKGFYNKLELNCSMNLGIHGGEKIRNEIGAASNSLKTNGDSTIGLEDASSVTSIDGKYISTDPDYKPSSNQNSSKNYCITRVTLGCDTVFSNNTSLKLAAFTGFYGDNDTWSQFNFQGFITGPYCELDLNGHTLIVEDGCSIEAIGSITDSSANKTGKIIFKKGSTLIASFVVEDQMHETGAPMTWVYGGSMYSMYRFPYLNATIIFEEGSAFQGRMMLDWGGSDYLGNKTSDTTINFVGSSDNDTNILDFHNKANKVGYIKREVSYDASLKSTLSEDGISNLLHQRITYSAYNVDIRVSLASFKASISGINLTVNRNKNEWNISPYFGFNLYDSSVVIKNNFNFLPGSYLNIDKNSKLILDYGGENYTGNQGGGGIDINSQYFVNVGGLNFIYEINEFDISNGDLHFYNDSGDTVGSPFTGISKIYQDYPEFWKYQNEYPAYCNLQGQIEFIKIDSSRLPNLSSSNGVLPYYQLGGNFIVNDVKSLALNINNAANVRLFATSHKSGPDRLTSSGTNKYFRLNVSDYFSYPLVVNGNVAMDVYNPLKFRSDFYLNTVTFDSGRGLIITDDGKYGFFPTTASNAYNDTSLRHFFRSNYSSYNEFYNGRDDLDGLWLKINDSSYNSFGFITVDDANVSFNSQTFCFFRGQYIKVRISQSGSFEINVGRLKMIEDVTKTDEWHAAKFVKYVITVDEKGNEIPSDDFYTHDAWRLTA